MYQSNGKEIGRQERKNQKERREGKNGDKRQQLENTEKNKLMKLGEGLANK